MGYMQKYDDLVEGAIETITRTVRERGELGENGEKFLTMSKPVFYDDIGPNVFRKVKSRYFLVPKSYNCISKVTWFPDGPEGGYIAFFGWRQTFNWRQTRCRTNLTFFKKHEVPPFLIMIVADDLS
jgi:hypothetical protein